MAAIDFSPATATYGAGFAGSFNAPAFTLWDQFIDVSNTAKWGVTATTWASGNTIDLLRLPIGAYIVTGGVEIITPESVTTTATISWGTSGAATAWANAFASNGTAGTTSSALLNTAGTSINVAASVLARITVNTAALTNVRFRVFLVLGQLGRLSNSTLGMYY